MRIAINFRDSQQNNWDFNNFKHQIVQRYDRIFVHGATLLISYVYA